MKKIFIIVIIFGAAAAVCAKTIWQDKNIYSPAGGLNIGDIIIVKINDLSNLRFSLAVGNKTSSDIASNPDATITGFLPKVSGSKKINQNDSVQFSGKGQINFTIAARIVNKAPAGVFGIAGSKTYTMNGIANVITVTGLIDPGMMSGREIDSGTVADFRMEIRGIREGINIRRAALKENEKAETQLTEKEKQQILLEYLQKMINELTR